MGRGDYRCTKCHREHKLTSKIGEAHIEYAQDERIRIPWTKYFKERKETSQ